jgi:spore coat polysaccharide biosynthesis protein SpsF (cytidylyltransferase family)
MKTITVVQARMSSTRLPNKILLPIGNCSLFKMLRTRIENANHDEIWLATTTKKEDDLLVQFAAEWGWKIFRGKVDDVLSRFESIIDVTSPDLVVRVTGDNPLVDKYAINELIRILKNNIHRYSYVSDFLSARYPLGYFPEIIKASRLNTIRKDIKKSEFFHLSHVTSKIVAIGKDLGEIYESKNFPYFRNARWTIDYPLDFEFITQLNSLSNGTLINMKYLEIYNLINKNPFIAKINTDIKQKNIKMG